MTLGQLSLKGRALKYLAAREHSRAELERKLAPHEEAPGQVASILDDLAARGFLSDQRAAEALVHRRASKLGAARIRQELQSRGLAAEAIGQAMESVQASELARAREVWLKKFGTPPGNAAERGRQMRFMASRGFGADVLRRVVAGSDEDACL